MNNLVRGTLDKLYDHYFYVDFPNVQVPSGSKTTHIEGDAISCTDLQWRHQENFSGCSSTSINYII